ncbi:MAG: winged helix-turn-helix transcriptional regulator [Archaeoglobaceae archaeon]
MLLEIAELLERIRIKPSDVRIYNLLRNRELGVREIAKELNLSTRFVRDRLKELTRRGILKRRLVEEGWIGYKYTAEEPREVLNKLKAQLHEELLRLEKTLVNI